MAKIGLNNFRYGIATIGSDGSITYGVATKPGKAVSFSFEPTKSDAKLYADDSLAESDSQVTGGTCTIGIDRFDDTTMAALLGHTNNDGEIISSSNDVAPYVGLGRVTRLLIDGVQSFRVTFLSQVKFSEPSQSDTTRGESIEFSTYELEGNVVVPANGVWRIEKTFTDQSDAISYLEGLFGASPVSL